MDEQLGATGLQENISSSIPTLSQLICDGGGRGSTCKRQTWLYYYETTFCRLWCMHVSPISVIE